MTNPIKKKEKEVAIEPMKPNSIEGLIGQAINKGVPVDTMERLLAMRRELKAEAAKEAFDEDMARFQGDCPVIAKTTPGGKTNSGKVAYYYATLDQIVKQVSPILERYGFSYMIKTKMADKNVTVSCLVKHREGHAEESAVEMPIGDRTAIMSAPQAVAATITFAKRYAFCNAFGILTGDEDNDANKDNYVKPANGESDGEKEFEREPFDDGRISKPQIAKLFTLLKPLGVKDREEARKFCSAALQKPVEGFRISAMSKKEASIMIDRLESKEPETAIKGEVVTAPNTTEPTKEEIAEIDKGK